MIDSVNQENLPMIKIKLLADSTCDLSPKLVEDNKIGIIPLYVNFGIQSYQDNVDITPKELYARVKRDGALPTTAAPTPDNFKAEFEKYVAQGQDIIYISISSKLSSSYQNACTAAAQFPSGKVTVIDSHNLSSGIGLLVMIAADCLQKGWDVTRTVAAVQAKIDKVETEFIIDSVEYLHKGGRCSGLQMFLSSLLKIHPIIEVANGSMHLAAKVRGGRQQVMDHLLTSAINNLESIDVQRVFVTHSESPEDAFWLKNKLENQASLKDVIITEAGCVISTHCGPKTVGILYLKK